MLKFMMVSGAAVALAGCGANTMGSTINNPNCTTKISGEVSFGSLAPTGKGSFSAVCKHGDAAPDPAKVSEPAKPAA